MLNVFQANTPDFFDPSEQKELEQYLEEHGNSYFVALENDQLVGGAGFHLEDNHTGRISWVLFDPNFQHQGFGSELVQMCIDELRKIDTVNVITAWTSNAAFHFFEKFGFETVDFQGNFWGPGLDLYKMAIRVNSRSVD